MLFALVPVFFYPFLYFLVKAIKKDGKLVASIKNFTLLAGLNMLNEGKDPTYLKWEDMIKKEFESLYEWIITHRR